MKICTVEITQEDIDQAGSLHRRCPAVLAVCRAFNVKSASVGYKTITVYTDKGMLNVYTTPQLEAWLKRYEDGEKVGPMAFDLEI